MERNSSLELLPSRGWFSKLGYRYFSTKDGVKTEHVLIAKKALGKPLPKGAEVHHVDGNKSNNDHSNLVVCPDHAYHFILETRARALSECGNANFRRCWICKEWDDPKNLTFHSRFHRQWHRKCMNQYLRKKRGPSISFDETKRRFDLWLINRSK